MYGCNWRARTRRSRVESLRQTLTVWWMTERSLWVLLDTSAAAVGHNQIAQGCLFHNYTTQIALPGGVTYERCSLSSLSSKKLQWNCEKILRSYRADREGVYGGCSVWNDPSDPIRLAVMIIEIFPIWLWPVQSPAVANSSTVRGQGEVGAEWVGKGEGVGGLFCLVSSSCSLSPSSSYSLLWFMMSIHLQAVSISSSLLGDHGSSCALRAGSFWTSRSWASALSSTRTHPSPPKTNKQTKKYPSFKTYNTVQFAICTVTWTISVVSKSVFFFSVFFQKCKKIKESIGLKTNE